MSEPLSDGEMAWYVKLEVDAKYDNEICGQVMRRWHATVEARDNLLRGLGKAGLQALSELSAYTTKHHRDLLQRLSRIHEFGVEIALREEGERDA